MKIRIRDNSVRLRLSRGEVEAIRADGVVSSSTGFPGNAEFRYTLESDSASVNPGADFSGNEIRIRLPKTVVDNWTNSEQVSVHGEQRLDNGDTLVLLIEKDFACLAPRVGEDESDMYPHPNADEATC